MLTVHNQISFNFQIINIVDDDHLINNETLEDYFVETIYPLAVERFQIKRARPNPENGEPFIISLLMKAIHCETLTIGKV